jgi:3-methyladenine DNA glycosylase/8-oxoguanine DNA glycosylase
VLKLETPPGFSFVRTVLSHGWCLLPPFRLGPEAAWLDFVVADGRGGALSARVYPDLRVTPARPATLRAAARILALDVDVAPLHARVAADPDLAWIATCGAGRLLRAPTMWEDLVKLVLTTNCSWSLTVKMTEALVTLWGDATPDGRRAFPTPERLARVPESALRARGRLGYRAPFVRALARKVAAEEVDLERLDRKQMLDLPGVGPYVADNLLKFLGRPQGLGLDSWMRAKYARLHHGGRRVSDKTIARRYRHLDVWAGIALWLTLTRDWFEGEAPSRAWTTLT